MDKKPRKEIVELSPQNSEYMQKIAQARATQHPVGGVPMPKMPNFAEAQKHGGGDRFAGVQQQSRAQGMAALLTPEQRAQLDASGKMIPGVGSAFVANQPAVAGQPQAQQGYQNPIRGENAGLKTETVEQLAAVAEANAPEKKEEKEKESEQELDDIFDFDEFGNRVKNILANKQRREAIEARCAPISLMDLLVNQEVRQEVPIVPKKYVPTFRTMGGDEDLEVKRILASSSVTAPTYVLGRMTLMNLTCGLYAINGKVFPSIFDKDGNFSVEAFDTKYKAVLKYPVPVLADLAVNYTWFDARVRNVLTVENIKDF